MRVIHHVLNPEGTFVGAGEDPQALARFLTDNILTLDDHSKYSVASYEESAVMPGKALLKVQVSAEEFVKQVKDQFQ